MTRAGSTVKINRSETGKSTTSRENDRENGSAKLYVCRARSRDMPPVAKSPDAHLPLRPVEFEILLTLASGERHGYAILQEIAERSDGALQLETGTMYRALRRLVETGLVRPASHKTTREADDERRRYYAITALGARVATAEADRMARLVATARLARLLSQPST